MIKAAEFARRRKQLMRMADDDAIIILPSAPLRVRSHDTHYPYRQDSDFWYLAGFAEPEAVLVLVPGRKHGEALLFCRERDAEREAWDGPRAGPEGAVEAHGFDDAYPIADLDEILPGLLEGRSRVYYHFGRDTEFDLKLIGWVNRVRSQVRHGAQPPHEFLELGHLLHELRLFKSAAELKLMRESARIACEAQLAAMRATRPGGREYEVEAALQYVYRRNNAVAAYEPIVGSGPNACVLHYRDNRAPTADGDLLLCDAGAEFANYASDITRTWPVNGRYSKEQRALYEVVLSAQAAALDQARPGQPWIAGHEAAVTVLTEGLLSLGLLKGSLKSALASGSYKKFYMHKTGHWLGLDVHDVGEYKLAGEYRQLEPGMVFTIEPGLYIAPGTKGVPAKWQGIGIRIEDDVLVTREGHEVLTDGVPKSVDAVQDVLASR
ncbi:MAG TPA: aminopeptidase P N-terminal domain-containing protein [Arenimonas sp.]|uniref:aminopeptidase P N-terminal domain-containing protein n=1 Tax=Arenimonas sp. TaxID=1872635 RepID=UPI002D80FE19|nr:aminopeptidase P N-terminal domain-containing protein [Arenimonas sp.]HEU0151922.1 aminopeptidase P N-terminal domain-containing protein [Arenimonas sp.]